MQDAHRTLVVCLRGDGAQPLAAQSLDRAVIGILRLLPRHELSATILAHVLRGSPVPLIQELIATYALPRSGSLGHMALAELRKQILDRARVNPQVFALREREVPVGGWVAAGDLVAMESRSRLSTAPKTEREDLLSSFAATIGDYRMTGLFPLDGDHVARWASQFDADVQIPLLRELGHVLEKTYLSRQRVLAYLEHLTTSPQLPLIAFDSSISDPASLWRNATLLDIQQNGHSQRDMLDLFHNVLRSAFGPTLPEVGSRRGPFVYLDDVVFSGNRVVQDLGGWIRDAAPASARVLVLTMASHTHGRYDAKRRLTQLASEVGKKVAVTFVSGAITENHLANRDSSGVLWPTRLPDDPLIHRYMAGPPVISFQARTPASAGQPPFRTEEGRSLLERELLMAGLRIRTRVGNPKSVLRPLGFSHFGLGFGSLIVTYRNCPNNAPLALWWGGPGHEAGSALDWYPLFQRVTYDDAR